MISNALRTRIQQAQSRFARDWNEFQQSRGEAGDLQRVFGLIRQYDELSGYLYRLRAEGSLSNDPLHRRLEDFASDMAYEISALQIDVTRGSTYRTWVARYRTIWKENFSLFNFTALVFLSCVFLGWFIVVANPDYAEVIIGQHMMEEILDKHRWFEEIQKNPFLIGVQIALNNIKVALMCFVAGALFGIGGLLLLAFNGVLFGAIGAYCYINHFHDALSQFVVGHGFLELTIIVASTFASFLFGRVFFMRPYSLFRRRLSLAAGDAGTIVTGILPWLVLAACIEVFVSPWHYLDTQWKVIVGILAGSSFWIWTLWPVKKRSASR